MVDPISIMSEKGIDFLLSSYTALDRYFHIKVPGTVFINTDATLILLAQTFDRIEYPGVPFEDASIYAGTVRYAFRCVDNLQKPMKGPFTVQNLLYDSRKNIYLDPNDIYADLRSDTLVYDANGFHSTIVLMEAARLVSRYHYEIPDGSLFGKKDSFVPTIDMQRDLLVSMLLGKNPDKGFKLLLEEGFIEKYWPELYTMCMVSQTKDYHPEGDVWQHTIETFKHRKKADLVLSLGLLLHDIGKPIAEATPDKPFNDHSELGTKIAMKFLSRLGFDREIVESVTFLVRFHMLPAAIKKLPIFRTENVMSSPIFPTLLELYRADLESSFRQPKGYYEACGVYREFMKSRSNPYRISKEYKTSKKGIRR